MSSGDLPDPWISTDHKHAVISLPGQSIDQAALALWLQLEHNIRLALAGEVAKVKSFPGHLNFGT